MKMVAFKVMCKYIIKMVKSGSNKNLNITLIIKENKMVMQGPQS